MAKDLFGADTPEEAPFARRTLAADTARVIDIADVERQGSGSKSATSRVGAGSQRAVLESPTKQTTPENAKTLTESLEVQRSMLASSTHTLAEKQRIVRKMAGIGSDLVKLHDDRL